jgi:hypothetical protein
MHNERDRAGTTVNAAKGFFGSGHCPPASIAFNASILKPRVACWRSLVAVAIGSPRSRSFPAFLRS